MPYINQKAREDLAPEIVNLSNTIKDVLYDFPVTEKADALAYCITSLINLTYDQEMRQNDLYSLIGILEAVKTEFLRRRGTKVLDKNAVLHGTLFKYD